MKLVVALLLLTTLCDGPHRLFAFDAATDIRAVLATQTKAWNNGDVEAFMKSYADNCTFMGQPVLHSRHAVLARYRKVYPNAAAMGTLTFADLDIHEIAQNVAVATGTWHLVRTAAAGGDTGGYFSLVLKSADGRWEIILDHTTALPNK